MAKTEDLKAAAVGQQRAIPVHELVQPAEMLHRLATGPQIQVVRVAEDYAGAETPQLFGRHRLDTGLRAHGHEHRRLYRAVWRLQDPRASDPHARVDRSHD